MSGQAAHTGGHQGTRPSTNGSNAGAVSVPQQRATDGSINVGNGGQVPGGMSQPHLNGIVRNPLSSYHNSVSCKMYMCQKSKPFLQL